VAVRISTLILPFPQSKIFQSPDFAMNCGVISLHRKRNLPAEESRIEALKRIGNETHERGEEAFTADVMTEAREGRGNSPDPSSS
jgi:hypothetical protein